MKLTKMYMLLSVLFIALIAPLLAFGQDVTPVTDLDIVQKIINFMSEYKTMSAGAVALAVVQLIVALFNSPMGGKLFAKLDAQLKLIIITFLTLASGLIAGKIAGIPVMESLLQSANLALLQVGLHQFYLKFIAKKE